MSIPTHSAITYGKALAQALRVFNKLEPSAGWFERLLIRLLRKTYHQRLQYLIDISPPEISAAFFEIGN